MYQRRVFTKFANTQKGLPEIWQPFWVTSPTPLPAKNHPLLAAFNGLNPHPQSVILISHKNTSAILSRPKGSPAMAAESKTSVQVKKPSASSPFIQQRNLAFAEITQQEPCHEP
jgi:hypothetical protein